jgi:thiol-disulfide isomerase/thioredoxin
VTDYIENIAKELNNANIIEVDVSKLTANKIHKIKNNEIIRIKHPKGFNVEIRKEYKIDYFLGIPTLLYSVDKYSVCDELLGQHPISMDYKDVFEYVCGLIGI